MDIEVQLARAMTMNTRKRCGTAIFSMVICAVGFAGCAFVQKPPASPSSPQITVTVTPGSASIQAGSAEQFTATVQNDTQNKGVSWSLTQSGNSCSPTCGSLSGAGTQVLYSAPSVPPSSSSVTLAATSVTDKTKSSAAQITVMAANSQAISVVISPSTTSLQASQSQQFTAAVQNDNQNKGVVWSLTQSGVACSPACGSIVNSSPNQALYSAPNTLPNSSNVTVTANSIADNTKSASAQLALTLPTSAEISVSISPTTASVQLSQSQQFTASVQNDPQNRGVTWALTQSGIPCSPACGSLPAWTSSSVLYTAAAVPVSTPVVILTATSVADQTKTATTTIYVATPFGGDGSNALVDVTSYGARATVGQLAATASCTSGSPNVSISADPGFENGDGVVLYGCGPSTSIAAPSAPTVNPGMAEGEMAPDIPLAPSTGSSTYQYSMFLTTTSGGLTASSSSTTITSGPGPLGMVTVNVASATLVGGTLTITTSSPHGMPVRAWFNFRAAVPTTLNGRYSAYAVTPTTITVTDPPFQAPGAGFSTVGGTVTYAVGNQISVASVPTGTFNAFVCGKRPGESALHIIGAIPVGGYARGYYFTDWGSSFSLSASNFPSYITDASCTASSATPGYLRSIILSGAGTTSLVLANDASQSASGVAILRDDGPAFEAAAIASLHATRTVYIPIVSASARFIINSITTLPNSAKILQAGNIVLNEPIQQLNVNWQGTSGTCAPQFALKGTTCLFSKTAFPAMYLTGDVRVSNVSLMMSKNSLGMVTDSGSGLYLDTVQFSGLGLGTIHFVTFGQTDIATIKDCLFSGSQDGSDASWVPAAYFDSKTNSGGYTITNPRLSGRGMFVNNNTTATPAFAQIRQVTVTDAYDQGASLPILVVQNTGTGNNVTQIYMSAPQIDTSPEAAIALAGIPGFGTIDSTVTLIDPNSSGSTAQFVTGVAPTAYYPEGVYFPSGVIYPEAFTGDVSNGGQLAVARPYAYDNFNRANGPLGSNWQVLSGSFSVNSNQVVDDAANGEWSLAQWIGPNNSLPNEGQFSQVTITNLTASAGPFVLCSPSNLYPLHCGYQCVEDGRSLRLVGGTRLNLPTAYTPANGDILRIEWNPSGNIITCYVNGVPILSGADSGALRGQPGVISGGSAAYQTLDNWSGGSLHPYSTSDEEEDRTRPLHVPSLTIGPTSPGSHGDIPFGAFYPASVIFGNLGTPDNGAVYYCPDCVIANPCSGGGTGAIAKRLNGVWVCN